MILERNAAILEYANMYNYGSFILGLRHERLRQKRVCIYKVAGSRIWLNVVLELSHVVGAAGRGSAAGRSA